MATELVSVAQILLAAVLGAAIGWERERRDRPAGIRTHILVATGSALFTIIGIELAPSNPAAIAAGIVSGIGFLGAGLIIHESGGDVHGLTTAASIWGVAAVGTAIGAGFYPIALASGAIMFLAPFIPHLRKERKK